MRCRQSKRAYLRVRRVRGPRGVAQVRAPSVGHVAGLSCHSACQPHKGTGCKRKRGLSHVHACNPVLPTALSWGERLRAPHFTGVGVGVQRG